MEMNFELMVQAMPLLLTGAVVTVKITALSVFLGILIGLFVGIARISTYKIVHLAAAVYVDFLRGTPLLVQIFLVYFALPVLTGQRIDPFIAAIAARIIVSICSSVGGFFPYFLMLVRDIIASKTAFSI